MPRIARGLGDSFIYHVLNRGNGKQDIFHKQSDYMAFVELMKQAKEKFLVKIFKYCLMPNHFHIVVMPVKAEELSKYMQWLMTIHVRRYHKHYGTSGHIWQGRFKSFVIQENNHLLIVMRYVERNPVRAGLAESAKDWVWSSRRESFDKNYPSLTDEIPIELPGNWEQYVDEPLTEEELVTLRSSVNRGAPYGEESWRKKAIKELGLESTVRKIGRPKKGDIKRGQAEF